MYKSSKQNMLDDKKRFEAIKGIQVVSGYHYGYKKRKSTSKKHLGKPVLVPYIDTHKLYDFRITSKTHNLRYNKVGNVASVITKFGKRQIVVIKELNPDGSKAVQMAKQLRPVINFRNYSLDRGKLGWLYKNIVLPKIHQK